MANVIEKSDDSLYGFYSDLREHLEAEGAEALKAGNWEGLQNIVECLASLEALNKYDGLIVISSNNGMGWAANKYQAK